MQKIIIIFEIYNDKEDFAKCMALVEGIEKKNLKENDDNWKAIIHSGQVSHILVDAQNSFSFMEANGVWNPKKVVYYIEKGLCGISNLNKYGKISSTSSFFKGYAKEREYYYYFRIKPYRDGNPLGIRNIQYYFLMLQHYEEIRGRVCAFFMPEEGNYFHKTQSNSFSAAYFRYSHFTRWMKGFGHMFGAFLMQNEIVLAPLTTKPSGVQNSFFPLMEIDESMVQNMQRTFRLQMNGSDLELPGSYDDNLKDIVNICNRFLEGNIKESVQTKTEIHKKEITEWIVRESNIEGISILELALFVNLVKVSDFSKESALKNAMYLVSNLNQGLLQIFENIVRHSEKRKGIFSFVLNVDRDGEDHAFWEMCVLDSNTKENLIDNFLGQHERIDSSLYKLREDICLAHFFKDFEVSDKDVVGAWKSFRNKNKISCLGLPHFADLLKSCEAEFEVVSSNFYRNTNEKLYYQKNYGNFESRELCKNQWNIPGTQFYIRCEVKMWEKYGYYADTQIGMTGKLIQNDDVLEEFVNWESERINIGSVEDITDTVQCEEELDDERKLLYANIWCEKMNSEFIKHKKKKTIYFIDVKTLGIEENVFWIEVFCKGFIASKLLNQDYIRYFAFVNCPRSMMQIFYRTLISSSVQYLPKLQIYLVSKSGMEELFLTGESRYAIDENIKEYGFFRGSVPVLLNKLQKKGSQSNVKTENIEVCPFDVLIKLESNAELTTTVFERYVSNISDYKLTDTENAGYKLQDTHMRLGSKVHLHDFYEISQFFQKMSIAQKFAFLIIKQMYHEIKKKNANILFYGYASYSRMILECLVELANKINKRGKFEFAVYQNDIYLQRTSGEINPTVKMYFSNTELNSGKHLIDKNTAIVQIVPISTTMTTFQKMWKEFEEVVQVEENKKKLKIYKNLTLFWVSSNESEKEYWEDISGNEIKTTLLEPYPCFFVRKETKWENPLTCELCYPEDVMWEKPLVETDPTSTIPSQQLEVLVGGENNAVNNAENNADNIKNEERVLAMNSSLYYGHITRDINHYRFYIDTAVYFQREKMRIKKWLENLRLSESDSKDIFHILVVPKHHTNVEFSYYVNNYFYEGRAHMMIIDSAKEFRTNFIGKYSDICQIIQKAYEEKKKISIAYVDDIIISGSTFRRVNSLLHSLVPMQLRKPIQCDKVFVLVNRLSDMSKMSYVHDPNKNFYSYVNIEISSIRNYGSSCILCNLKSDAQSFYLKSSTKMMSDYWSNKISIYDAMPFDQAPESCINRRGFYRFLCSHLSRNRIYKGNDKKLIILSIAQIFIDLADEKNDLPILEELKKDRKNAVYALLKVLCRPFFSFKRTLKECVLDFFLLLAEEYISKSWSEIDDEVRKSRLVKKEYLLDSNVWEKIVRMLECIRSMVPTDEEVLFVQKYILEGLEDLRSNYFIRKDTICNITRFLARIENDKEKIKEFFSHWSILIFRLINRSTDETKCLWLETLLTFWKEYKDLSEKDQSISAEEIGKKLNLKADMQIQFCEFWNNLIISNTRIYLENVEKCDKLGADEVWGSYYLKNLRSFSKVDAGIFPENDSIDKGKAEFQKMVELFKLLSKKETTNVKDRYKTLYQCLTHLLNVDTIWIIGDNESKDNRYYQISGKDDLTWARLESRMQKMSDSDERKELDTYGYHIYGNELLLKFCDVEQNDWKIAPLYILIRYAFSDYSKMIRSARMVMMFRYRLIQWIKEDFKNNALPIMIGAEERFRHLEIDRSGHHLSPYDLYAIQAEIESTTSLGENIDYSIRDWLLLKFYVNTRISKIYRCIWGSVYNNTERRESLYYTEKTPEDYDQELQKPLRKLSDLFWDDAVKIFRKSEVKFTAKNYLKIFEPLLEVTFKGLKLESIEKLGEKFQNVECINYNSTYLRREYVACMIMDILFSAIRCGFNWDLIYGEGDFRYRFMEDDTRMHYWYLKNNNDCVKCKVDFSIEPCEENTTIYNLVISNPVYLGTDNDIAEKNFEIQSIVQGKIGRGISLYTTVWYIEHLNEELKVKCFYEDREGKTFFVIKLPIIRRTV